MSDSTLATTVSVIVAYFFGHTVVRVSTCVWYRQPWYAYLYSVRRVISDCDMERVNALNFESEAEKLPHRTRSAEVHPVANQVDRLCTEAQNKKLDQIIVINKYINSGAISVNHWGSQSLPPSIPSSLSPFPLLSFFLPAQYQYD